MLLACSPFAFAQESTFKVCGDEILDLDSVFQWQKIEPGLPMYFGPGDTTAIYQDLLQRYLANLAEADRQRVEVIKFIDALQGIIVNRSALLTVSRNPITEREELVNGADKVFGINCADIELDYLVDILHLAIAYRKIHDASFAELRTAADQEIQRLNLQYQNWFDNGLPMWPQETWFNGLFLGESDASEAPRQQWVLLRPSVGLGGNTHDGLSNGNLDETLGVELFGYVRYRESDYSSYWGLSALATLGEDTGVGYGLLLRYDDYVLGYSRRDRDAARGIGEHNEYWYIGFDLYSLIHEKEDGFRDYKQKVRRVIAEYRQ